MKEIISQGPVDVNVRGWIPIETAPKDGTAIMVACPWLGVCGPAHWELDKYAKKPRPYWTHWGERIWGVQRVRTGQPTHWQPMPEAPNVQIEEPDAALSRQVASNAGLGVSPGEEQ